MPIFADLDLGGSHPWPGPSGGQVLGSVLVEGVRTTVWPRGGTEERQDVLFGVTAWQGLGGAAAGSSTALQYLLKQLRELALNPALQPVYIRWTSTAQTGGQLNVADLDDGWYVIENLQPDYQHNVVAGFVTCRATVARVAPANPSPLALRWTGGALLSTYSSAPQILLSYPVGSTQQVPTTLSRTGGEGTIPLSVLGASSAIQPAPFARPGTVAALYTGGVKVYDSVSAGGNAVPAAGAGFANASWVQVYGSQHGVVGDLVLTNGLLLLRFNQAASGLCDVYLWNTQGTAGWQQYGTLKFKDASANVGTLRSIDVARVGLMEARVAVSTGTSAGNYATFTFKLLAGHYAAYVDFEPDTQGNTAANGLALTLSTAVKIVANSGQAYDVNVGALNLTPTADAGWSVAIGSTANQPIGGFLWQNPPNTGQPDAVSTTELGFGETTGPTLNATRRYGIWAAPFVTSPNLLGEAESGTLGTGWTSVTDGSVQAAKCASGTASGQRDIWGTSWIPPAGVCDMAVRLRVASVASSTSQMQIGLWDDDGGGGSGAYVASTTYAPNAAGLSTSYVWVRVCIDVTPTATHHMRFRAVTTATTTTDWFFDQAVLVPKRSSTLGQGDLPADVWAQWAFETERQLVRG